MFSITRNSGRLVNQAKRNFQTSAISLNKVYGTPLGGVYSNIPFQIKNRKYIPFAVYYWGTLGFFLAFPFLTTWWHLKKSGSFDQ